MNEEGECWRSIDTSSIDNDAPFPESFEAVNCPPPFPTSFETCASTNNNSTGCNSVVVGESWRSTDNQGAHNTEELGLRLGDLGAERRFDRDQLLLERCLEENRSRPEAAPVFGEHCSAAQRPRPLFPPASRNCDQEFVGGLAEESNSSDCSEQDFSDMAKEPPTFVMGSEQPEFCLKGALVYTAAADFVPAVSEVTPSKSVYIRGLNKEFTVEILEELFSLFGQIEGVRYQRKGRKFGHVDYEELAGAEGAVKALNGCRVVICPNAEDRSADEPGEVRECHVLSVTFAKVVEAADEDAAPNDPNQFNQIRLSTVEMVERSKAMTPPPPAPPPPPTESPKKTKESASTRGENMDSPLPVSKTSTAEPLIRKRNRSPLRGRRSPVGSRDARRNSRSPVRRRRRSEERGSSPSKGNEAPYRFPRSRSPLTAQRQNHRPPEPERLDDPAQILAGMGSNIANMPRDQLRELQRRISRDNNRDARNRPRPLLGGAHNDRGPAPPPHEPNGNWAGTGPAPGGYQPVNMYEQGPGMQYQNQNNIQYPDNSGNLQYRNNAGNIQYPNNNNGINERLLSREEFEARRMGGQRQSRGDALTDFYTAPAPGMAQFVAPVPVAPPAEVYLDTTVPSTANNQPASTVNVNVSAMRQTPPAPVPAPLTIDEQREELQRKLREVIPELRNVAASNSQPHVSSAPGLSTISPSPNTSLAGAAHYSNPAVTQTTPADVRTNSNGSIDRLNSMSDTSKRLNTDNNVSAAALPEVRAAALCDFLNRGAPNNQAPVVEGLKKLLEVLQYGQCTPAMCGPLFEVLSSLVQGVLKLNREKKTLDETLAESKQIYKDRLQSAIALLSTIDEVMILAQLDRHFIAFTRPQRSNIKEWAKDVQEVLINHEQAIAAVRQTAAMGGMDGDMKVQSLERELAQTKNALEMKLTNEMQSSYQLRNTARRDNKNIETQTEMGDAVVVHMKIIALLSPYLSVHPRGCTDVQIVAYLAQFDAQIQKTDVNYALSRLPTMFTQNFDGHAWRWFFTAYNQQKI